MPVNSEVDLALLAARVSRDLQDIQDYLGARNFEHGRIRFPWGVIRKAEFHRDRYWFLKNETLRRNVAYALMTTDVHRWLINRTTIKGTAKEMIIKEVICALGAVAESVTKDVLRGQPNTRNFKPRTARLVEQSIITAATKIELDWLWDQRNNEHLFMVDDREHQKYKITDYNRAVRALQALRASLTDHFTEDVPF